MSLCQNLGGHFFQHSQSHPLTTCLPPWKNLFYFRFLSQKQPALLQLAAFFVDHNKALKNEPLSNFTDVSSFLSQISDNCQNSHQFCLDL